LQALRDENRLTPAGFASLATVRGRQGHYAEQLALAQEGLARTGDGPPVPALSWPLVFGSLRLGLLEQAEETASRFITLAAQGEDPVRLAEAWQLQATVWRHTRPAAEATVPLHRARRIYEELGWHGRAADLHLDELELALRNGETEGAAAHLRALESVVGAERTVFHARRLRLLGTAERRAGQSGQAETSLLRALEATRAAELNLEQTGLPLELADTLLQQARPAEAAAWLQAACPGTHRVRHAVLKALMTGEDLNAVDPAHLNSSDAETRLRAHLLLAAQGDPAQRSLVQDELRRNPHASHLHADSALNRALRGTPAEDLLIPEEQAPAVKSGPEWHLTLLTLGDLQVHLNGQPVQIGLAKARELLVWLAIHGSGSRDELVTALWDGSAEERHVEYFRVAVRRLRSALKSSLPVDLDPLPYAAGRYRLSPALHVEVDVLSAAGLDWSRPFLPGVDTEWVQDYRSRTAQQAVTALLSQAAATTPDGAVPLYRQLLTLDPLLAPAHEGLIRALLATGDPEGARRALGTYRRMLASEYGAPLPDTFMDSLPATLTV